MSGKGGYGVVFQEVMRCETLSPESKAIYAYLASFAGKGDTCYPSLELMWKELKMGSVRFSKYMNELIALGVVEKTRERCGNVYGRNLYKINHSIEIIENSYFELLENEAVENQAIENEAVENRATNNNSLNNNSLNNNNTKNITVSKDTVRQTEVQRIVEEWNKLESYGIKSVSKLSPSSKRYQSLTARIKEYSLEDVLKAIENIKQSKFLQGKTDSRKQWVITFDWFVLPNNFPKVLDGNYADKEQEEPEEDDRSIYRTDYTELYEQIMKEGKPIDGPFK